MIKNKTLIIATIAGVVGLSALGAVTFANDVSQEKGQGMFGRMMQHGERGPRGGQGMFGHGQEGNAAAHEAMIAGDYDAFITAIQDAPFADSITEEQFAQMTQRAQQEQAVQTAIENNDYAAYLTAVQTVFAEHSSASFFNDIVAKRLSAEKIKAAIEAEDYDAYVAAVQGTEREGKLTQEQFTAMIAHKAEGMSGEKGEGLKERMKKNFQEDGVKTSRNSLQASVMAGDYDAFVAAIAGTALEGKITQVQFDSVVVKFKK